MEHTATLATARKHQDSHATENGNDDAVTPVMSKNFVPDDVRAPKLIIALPAYNEEESLPQLLTRIGETFCDLPIDYEVIVVDDGSKDRTADVARDFSTQMPVRLHQHVQNQGLGGTIRDCLKLASQKLERGDIVVTLDADNTHPPELIPSMIEKIRVGHDIVIASRFQRGARVVGVPLNRKWMSIFARAMFQTIFPITGVRDYTCGYRAYRAEVLQNAFEKHGDSFCSESGFASMCDILLKLRSRELMICEVPMLLRYDFKGGDSKMQVIKTITGSLRLIIKRRLGRMD